MTEPVPERRAVLTAAHPGLSIGERPLEGVDAVIAVKPDVVDAVLPVLAGARVGRVLSIAAGVTTQAMEAGLPDGVPVVRSMPNTPALVGEGMAAIAAGPQLRPPPTSSGRHRFWLRSGGWSPSQNTTSTP